MRDGEGRRPVQRPVHLQAAAPVRIVGLKVAAKYLGMKPPLFTATQAVRPIVFAGTELGYDLLDCDKFLDDLKAGCSNDNDSIVARLA
jgi:hypothetical protein